MAKKVKTITEELDPQKEADRSCQNSLGRIAGGLSTLLEERKSLKKSPQALFMLNAAMAAKAVQLASEHEQKAGEQWGMKVLSDIRIGRETVSSAYAVFNNCINKKVGEIAAKTLQEKLVRKE